MERWRGLAATPPGWGRCVVTIGLFDGVHRGHQVIIGRAVTRAREARQPAVVVTFDPHPSELVRPGSHPAVLTPARRKAELLGELGVDAMCTIPFTLEFSRRPPAEFVHDALVDTLHASAVVVGRDFRFGHKAAGDVGTLSSLGDRFGFSTEAVDLVVTAGEQGARFSSTAIRALIAAGDVAGASEALGRPHRLEGVVVRGDARGRTLGYPTANLQPTPYAAVPADGVYAGWLLRSGGQRLVASVSIGTNPTFAGSEQRVEAYVLDFEGDLYGEVVSLEFAERLRPTLRFDDVEGLLVQMAQDVAATRALLA